MNAFFLLKIKKELQTKRYLDTLLHLTVAFLLFIVSSFLLPISKELIFFLSLLGSFIPDIDHLLLYKKERFSNFRAFIKWIIQSDRYRKGFELFHNAPTILVIFLSLPYIYVKNKAAFLFFIAFLFHLLTDLILDKVIVGKTKWWRFGL